LAREKRGGEDAADLAYGEKGVSTSKRKAAAMPFTRSKRKKEKRFVPVDARNRGEGSRGTL